MVEDEDEKFIGTTNRKEKRSFLASSQILTISYACMNCENDSIVDPVL